MIDAVSVIASHEMARQGNIKKIDGRFENSN